MPMVWGRRPAAGCGGLRSTVESRGRILPASALACETGSAARRRASVASRSPPGRPPGLDGPRRDAVSCDTRERATGAADRTRGARRGAVVRAARTEGGHAAVALLRDE